MSTRLQKKEATLQNEQQSSWGKCTFLPASAFFPAATLSATLLRRLALSCLVSGLYLGKGENVEQGAIENEQQISACGYAD